MTLPPTIVELEDRAVLAVTGADARSFLQGLLTNDLDQLAPDRPLYAGLLSPQGKALFDMILFAAPDGVLIDIAATRAPALARRLSMYKLRKAVAIAASPLRVVAGWNGGEAGHPADPRFAPLGARWLANSGPEPGATTYDAHRLAIGVPDSADIGEDELLWLETGADLLGGVSFTKGCYVGQENTARMHHRDKVRRRLVPVAIAGDPGDGVVRDAAGRTVGALRCHAGGRGFAHLRLEAAGGPLGAGDAALTVARPTWLEPALAGAVADA
ncbi:YgfZ/GcvT domain-containing protein [Sandarakinorhabdus sp. DWP1-3-1]|uniref:CAF17-like 4Fe-4S cluster assembly/insertion protein YgfZ n=1 Tax=Sandarakinorhabdus sp. DWP1-3-1 TaxID=2804627 RepID=UPI003CEFD397